jgi:hypothetical protein
MRNRLFLTTLRRSTTTWSQTSLFHNHEHKFPLSRPLDLLCFVMAETAIKWNAQPSHAMSTPGSLKSTHQRGRVHISYTTSVGFTLARIPQCWVPILYPVDWFLGFAWLLFPEALGLPHPGLPSLTCRINRVPSLCRYIVSTLWWPARA